VHSILRGFQHRNFRLFFIGQTLSMTGTWMQHIAISWLMYRLTGSAFMLGLTGFALQIPMLLVSPFAGVWVDRFGRQPHRRARRAARKRRVLHPRGLPVCAEHPLLARCHPPGLCTHESDGRRRRSGAESAGRPIAQRVCASTGQNEEMEYNESSERGGYPPTPRSLIMSTRANLEAALAEAEADLAKAATDFAKAYADPAETEGAPPEAFSDLSRARVGCIAALTALAKLNLEEGKPRTYRYERRRVTHQAAPGKSHLNRRKANKDRRLARPAPADLNSAELIVKPDGWIHKWMNRAVADREPGTTASLSDRDAKPHSTQSSGQPVRAVQKSVASQSSPRKEYRQFIDLFSGQVAGAGDTRTWRPLVWQAVQLLSLALAYLQYYFVDVKLQIVMLPPSVGALFAG